MTHKEGKKPQGKIVNYKELKEGVCPQCGTTLIELETLTGKPFKISSLIYYELFWICICPNGHGMFKVKESTHKMYMEGK